MYKNINLITAIITPFNEKNEIDYPALDHVIDHLLSHGTQGLVIAGTTGESPTLTHAEKLALTRHIVDYVADDVLLIANAGTNNTAESVQNAKELGVIDGVDAILAVTPYYNKPSQAGMIAHFEAIADASPKPVMLYNIPGRSAVGLTVDSVVTLAQHPNINAVKETTSAEFIGAEVEKTQAVDFSVYTGEDAQTLAAYSQGGAGTISVAAHLYGDDIAALFTAMNSGDWREAGRLQRYLTPRMNALFAFPSPAPVKASLSAIGMVKNIARLPILPLTTDEQTQLNELLEG
ncbi:4-hydroxy-tetrahydrodipicolinate synthase [Leuconostoc carnosum]|uniref:4-hydroxy-tetrahydrodipicolinate synthase n=1 Tax=Leuconostoc carnosum TaxID=1252 RepID=UPI00123C5BA0|nr:4-hydroxy-tetrahydrodipicolinate synthase [Leuconostoc carnosum]KAA8381236.1 4-hydroxy-tetrahydrodipicolinate synthase [Leuconostoc carnosum]